jgi:hypothetical protein
MKPTYEWRDCVTCEAKFIEDCKHLQVIIGGKNKIPEYCWREDLIRIEPKPHNNKER